MTAVLRHDDVAGRRWHVSAPVEGREAVGRRPKGLQRTRAVLRGEARESLHAADGIEEGVDRPGGQPLRNADGRRGPAHADRLRRAGREAFHHLGDLGALGRQRARDDEDRLDLRLGRDGVERLRQEREGLRAECRGRGEIDRVRRRRDRDEQRPQPLDARCAERRGREPEPRALVHRQDPVAAAESDDADARASRQPVPVPLQKERDVDKLLDRVHADHAQLAQHGVDHPLLADQGARVGLGGARARTRRPGLDEDHGLPPAPGLLERARRASRCRRSPRDSRR